MQRLIVTVIRNNPPNAFLGVYLIFYYFIFLIYVYIYLFFSDR